MKLLREYIRELLAEGMKMPVDLPDEVDVVIKDLISGQAFTVSYSSDDEEYDMGPWGRISVAIPARFNGPCDGALNVTDAEADPGWGPLLYDVAIEYATQVANGLISDRRSVSGAAKKVWDYYLSNRSDVTVHQLDNLSNSLTALEDDNCNQGIAGDQWTNSPLSKRYTKEPTTINALRAVDKLVVL